MSKSFQELWGETTPAETMNSEFKLLDTGEYEANIEQVSYDADRNRLSIEFNLERFLDDPAQNVSRRKSWASYVLEEKGVSFLKKDLAKLQVSFGSPKNEMELATTLHTALNAKRVKIFINQKEYNGKTYNNTYINALLTGPRNHAPQTQAEARSKMNGTPPQVDETESIPF